ncbi:MAG TPA: M23 family metallopeptidase [Methylomirabilota bacterium]|nr:M23 family metallopeptidase [Methylomirabilota bacterium]
MRRALVSLLALWGLLSAIAPPPAAVAANRAKGASPPDLSVRVIPATIRQGGTVLILVAGTRGAHDVEGSLGSQHLAFFPYGEEYAAVAGVDLETRPGKLAWRIGLVDGGGTPRKATGSVTVKAGGFPVERLTVAPGMVNLDPVTERRAVNEAARLRALYDTVTPERLWRGPFTRPVAARKPPGGFGARRIINGQPRMPHSGVDFSADRGTPVVAANRGRVALLGEFFFAGRLVVLDHGLGLYTLYFHLDGVSVTEGQLVERGETVGTVGTTGRSTGPHLHFAAQLGRARINPPDLFSLPVRD